QHLETLQTGFFNDHGMFLEVQTNQSEIKMVMAARTQVYSGNINPTLTRQNEDITNLVAQRLTLNVSKNQEIQVEKVVAVYTSRDWAISNPRLAALEEVQRAPSFPILLQDHFLSWQGLWHRCDRAVSTIHDGEVQALLRLHIFHLLQTTSPHITELDVGVPSRGPPRGKPTGGHIFWDEIYIFPLLNLSQPEITRSLLMYRYRRLSAAQHLAREAGHEGAMYPWQSGSDGREESQVIHLNPESGRWIPDNTHLQRHINVAIAYNTWQYYQASNDREFMDYYGAEMLLAIARFWASKVFYNKERDRYEIHQVVGPDEYHTQLPDSEEPGLRNNAYTNLMVVWTLVRAQDTLKLLDNHRREALQARLKIEKEDLDRWETISRRMFIPFLDEEKQIISQFEGFEKLKELDWEKYRKAYGEILRLDRILENEGESVNRYKAVKQADVLMLFYLLSSNEIVALINRLGYSFSEKGIENNIDYYRRVASHGSTLSKLVYAWVMARYDRNRSWNHFRKALESDYKDIQGGTTHEGIHLGPWPEPLTWYRDAIPVWNSGKMCSGLTRTCRRKSPESTFGFATRGMTSAWILTPKRLILSCEGAKCNKPR
ncbi:MAG: glycoside hydrolase family 65 protein, partial [Bacteroidia bacterium]|nr:glycoside hydrolase family 65 protein [Bacteroidia bacterium]